MSPQIKFQFLFALLLGSVAWAQTDGDLTIQHVEDPPTATSSTPSKNGDKSSGSKSKIKLNFDSELIKGDVDQPFVDMISQRQEPEFKKMIHLRENFQPEVEQGRGDFRGQH